MSRHLQVAILLIIGGAQIGCGSGGARSSAPTVSPIPLSNASSPLVTPTYDGSGQATEPDVTYFDSSWHGFKYWMAYSPYPDGDERKENPSILASQDGIIWQLPNGLQNPLALPSKDDLELADASIFYDSSSDHLWVYYIDVFPKSMNVLRLVSPDGVNWQNQGVLFSAIEQSVLSPSISENAGVYYMWTVNGGSAGCYTTTQATVEVRTSADGVKWSAPRATTLAQLGYSIWHINVKWVPSKQQYWGVVAAFPLGSNCGNTVLFFASSEDGVHWMSYGKIALNKGTTWDQTEIYRSTLVYQPTINELMVWYAAQDNGVWHIGLSQDNFSDFLDWLQ